MPQGFSLRLLRLAHSKQYGPSGSPILPDFLCWWALDAQADRRTHRREPPANSAAGGSGLRLLIVASKPLSYWLAGSLVVLADYCHILKLLYHLEAHIGPCPGVACSSAMWLINHGILLPERQLPDTSKKKDLH
jgi:hypothetical protein